jgi:hypothetical protein
MATEIRKVATKKGDRYVASLGPTERLWAVYKGGDRPAYLTVSKFRGGWQFSVWGTTEAETVRNVADLDRRAAAATPAPARRPLTNGDIYRGRNGEEMVFGCGACRSLGRMCRRCEFDEYDN